MERIGQKLSEALTNAHNAVVDAQRTRDDLLDAWEKGDWDWLHLAGYLTAQELEAFKGDD